MASRPLAWAISTSSLALAATNLEVKSIQSRNWGLGERKGQL